MTLTWLDLLVKEMADKLPKAERRRLGLETDVEAAHQVLADYVGLARLRLCGDVPASPGEMAVALDIVGLYDGVLPFLAESWPFEPLAIQVVPELAMDLAGASPPAGPEWMAPIEHVGAVYIDLPHRALLPQADKELRALLIRDMHVEAPSYETGDGHWTYVPRFRDLPPDEPRLRFGAVVTPVGSDAPHQILTWYLGFEEDRRVGLQGAPLQVAHEINDFAKLLMLYYATASPAARLRLPWVERHRLVGLSRKKQRARQKAGTLFQVVRLTTPSDRFGRPDADRDKDGWKLGVRVRVRGHFRLQPYGPGASLRRLQWIAPYEKGPADGRLRPRLHKLLPANESENRPEIPAEGGPPSP